MSKFFIKNNQISENEITIIGSDVNHIINVLRLNIGNEIQVCNLDTQNNYIAKIVEENKESIKCKTLKILEQKAEANIHINIFQGLPKADKMELIIQKCTELGVKEITPLEMARCVVKLDEKSATKKTDRWQKIAEMASKQSGRDSITKINKIINIKNICNYINDYDIVLVAYENEESNTLKNELENLKNSNKKNLRIGIIIGPEGGFEKEEITLLKSKNLKVITLGRRILRTETVALVLTSIIMYELGDIGGM